MSARGRSRHARTVLGRWWSRWTWPPDKWQRLATVAELADPAGPVLDVGGRGHEMGRLVPEAVTSLNIEPPADVVVQSGPLPYAARSWDTVTSCDVLEHVPPDARAAHLAELVRVAQRRVVLCFPAGTPEKDAAERRLAELLDQEYGVRFDFLDEHLSYGLPRPAEVVATLGRADARASVTVRYTEGIEESDAVLVDAVRTRWRRDPRAAARFLRAWVLRPTPELRSDLRPASSRAYVVVDVSGAAR